MVRRERRRFDHALDTGFYNGGLLHGTRTFVHFEPIGFFNTEMIATCIPCSIRPPCLLPTRYTHYEYVAWKAESGLEIPSQVETVIEFFFLAKVCEGASFFGRMSVLAKEWIEPPIDTLNGQPISIHWSEGEIRINDNMLYGVVISAPKVETPERPSTIVGEKRCQAALERLMANDSKPEKAKEEHRDKLCNEFGISHRAFDRVWRQAIEKTGNLAWGKPGRKSRHRIDTPV